MDLFYRYARSTLAPWCLAVLLAIAALCPVVCADERPEMLPTVSFVNPLQQGDLMRAASTPQWSMSVQRTLRLEARPAVRRGSAFYRDHLLPEMEHRASGMSRFDAAYVSTTQPIMSDSLVYRPWLDETVRAAQDGMQGALESYLLETTALDRVVRLLDRTGEVLSSVSSASRTDARRRSQTDLGLSVSHYLPKVNIYHRVGAASFRFHVRMDGAVGIQLNHARSSWTHLNLDYDRKAGRYGLHYRCSF